MLNIEDSALVIIDIQDKLIQATGKYGAETTTNMAKVTRAANILNIPTIITEQYPQGLGNTSYEIKYGLNENSNIIEKKSFSAMIEPTFAHTIKTLNKKQIVIGGIETHICVLQTVSDLLNEGFEVYVLKDACASRNKKDYKTGIEYMKQQGAKITCTEITLFQWLRTSKHPNFKEVQALIK